MEEPLTSVTRELLFSDIEKLKEEISQKERIIELCREEGDENKLKFVQMWTIEIEMMHTQVYFLKTKLFS
jgi:hypothetical protein